MSRASICLRRVAGFIKAEVESDRRIAGEDDNGSDLFVEKIR